MDNFHKDKILLRKVLTSKFYERFAIAKEISGDPNRYQNALENWQLMLRSLLKKKVLDKKPLRQKTVLEKIRKLILEIDQIKNLFKIS